MDLERAIKTIEKVYGFDDETSSVGEAWLVVKETLKHYLCNCVDCRERRK